MAEPVRIQLSRRQGFRLDEAAGNGLPTVKVSRPGLFGNPFIVSEKVAPGKHVGGMSYFAVPTIEDAIACYREMLSCPGETGDAIRAKLPGLRGKNLACWCPIGSPCHADVLLEIANAPETA